MLCSSFLFFFYGPATTVIYTYAHPLSLRDALPILLIFLQLAGVIDSGLLRRGRRFAVVGICVLVAVITPSGDPISMLMLLVPMVLFYELSIAVGWLEIGRAHV